MGLKASEILDVIKRSDRCYQTVRGFVAERQLEIRLDALVTTGGLEVVHRINRDGQPDFRVSRGGRLQTIECKNVKSNDSYKKTGERKVDFQRTRNQLGAEGRTGRYYKPDEFDILAAAEHTSGGEWGFKFVRVARLPQVVVDGITCCTKVVRVPVVLKGTPWSDDVLTVLDAAGPPPTSPPQLFTRP